MRRCGRVPEHLGVFDAALRLRKHCRQLSVCMHVRLSVLSTERDVHR